MRTSVYKITIIALMAVANMLVLPLRNTVIYSQSVRQLPTRIRVEDTPADITIIGGVSRIVGSGDFNGDCVEDFLVEYRKLISEDTGTVVFIKFGMIFGKRNQTTPVKIDTSKDEPDLSLTTSVKGILGTFSIAKLGDLNDDGIDDLVLSQQLFGEIGKPGDRVFKILFGSQRFQSGVIDLDGLQPDLKIIADRGVSATGIAGVADVDGDGVRDILLTENAYYTDFALPILAGPFTTGQAIDLNSQQPDAIIRANNRYDRVTGAYLADVNGDALTDMLINRSRIDSRIGLSSTVLDTVFGSPDLKGGVEISLSDGHAGAEVAVGSDPSAIATGDVNGDGIDDILVGEPTYNGEPAPPPWFSGSVTIIFGSQSMRGTVNRTDEFILGIPPPNPFYPIYQTTLGDRLGASLAVTDVNGDGAPDILVGAPGLTSDKKGRVTNLSRVHVILGSTEIKSGAQIDTAQSQQDITISFDSEASGFGRQIGSGDFNGDGVSDILVASYSAVYVFFGGPLRAPEITKAKYRSGLSEVSIFGTDFTGSTRVEINGLVVDRPVSFDPDTNKLFLNGTRLELNLQDGKNQVAVIRKGSRSNTVKVKMQ